MEKLNREAVDLLLASSAKPAVTIYAPMIPSGAPPHISENQIRLKNLMHAAASELGPHGAEHELSKMLLETYDKLNADIEFWESQTPGLLICANSEGLKMFNLPLDTEEYVAIDDQFHLAPVLGLLADDRQFYLLTIAQQNPRLYKGDMYGLHVADVKLPASIADALNIDEANQKSENQGTATGPSSQGAASSPASGGGWFNGRGGAKNPQEADRMRFFRVLDAVVMDKADRSLPIILGGTESEIAEFRSISKHPHILNGTIPGNQADTETANLFDQAYKIIQHELIEPDHAAAVEEYTRLSGANPDRVAHDQKAIKSAAEQGRIDKLLASVYRNTTDTVSDSFADVIRITFPGKDNSRTLNNLAVTVWQMSGKVVNVLPDQIPNNALMVARLRY
jgi:hypothetical protein